MGILFAGERKTGPACLYQSVKKLEGVESFLVEIFVLRGVAVKYLIAGWPNACLPADRSLGEVVSFFKEQHFKKCLFVMAPNGYGMKS
jgi:hypothetical protein